MSGLAGTIAVLYLGLNMDPNRLPSQLIDQVAPDFTAEWVAGQENLEGSAPSSLHLSDYRGQAVILNFWASWCVSCREEAREMEAFWRRNKGKVAVIGIAIQDENAAALRFAKEFGKTYFLGRDLTGEIAIDYGVTGVPETFFIDKAGLVKYKETGPVTLAFLEEMLPKL